MEKSLKKNIILLFLFFLILNIIASFFRKDNIIENRSITEEERIMYREINDGTYIVK